MKRAIWIALLGACISLSAKGQISTFANPTMSVATASEHNNGTTIAHNTLVISGNTTSTYTLQVRATADMVNGVNSIPMGNLYIQATAPIVGSEINLTTTNKTLFVSKFPSTYQNRAFTFNYRMAGGTHLYKPAGAYTMRLVFTLTTQ